MTATRVLSLIAGILLIIAGVTLIGTPVANVVALGYFAVFSMIIFGIVEIVMFFTSQTRKHDWWLIVSGTISLILGVWALLDQGGIIAVSIAIPIFFSIWLIASGIMRIVGSLKIKKFNIRNWWVMLVVGIIGLILGIFLVFNPGNAFLTIGFMVPLIFIFQGITSVVQFFTLRN